MYLKYNEGYAYMKLQDLIIAPRSLESKLWFVDNVLSQIILDNTNAAEQILYRFAGSFIIHD